MISANALVASIKKQCDHIVLPCAVASKETLFNTFAMADCGATALFIDFFFAQLHGLKLSPLQHPQDFTVANGRTISSGAIAHTVTVQTSFALGAHTKILKLFVTTLDQYPVVLSLLWLQKHGPHIRFHKNTVTFDSKCCLDHCIATHQALTICGADNTFDTLYAKTPQIPQKTHETRRSTPKPQYSPRSSHRIDMADCMRKMNQKLTLLDKPIVTKPIVTKYTGAARTPTEPWTTGEARNPIKYTAGAARQPTEHTASMARTLTEDITSAASKTINIHMIGAAVTETVTQ